MTQPNPGDDPSAYEWALGYEFTPDPLGLGDEWQFIYQSMPDRDSAVAQYQATVEGIANMEGGVPNIRNLGVYFTAPVTWQPYDATPIVNAVARPTS